MKEYIDDKQVEEVGSKVLKMFDYPEQPLVKFLKMISDKSNYLGKCSRATGKWKYLTDKDFVIEIWDKWWETANEHQKEALMYHEVSHIDFKEKDDEITWRLKRHDIEEFNDVVKKYGTWNEELIVFKNNLGGATIGEIKKRPDLIIE